MKKGDADSHLAWRGKASPFAMPPNGSLPGLLYRVKLRMIQRRVHPILRQ